ncbi:MAG: InlB B-repeat-containing protein [Clostridia bacterium]|nr:InlB B-repeat-containing protein [Clostridia bacterium]
MLKGSKRIVFLLFMLVVCGLCLSLAACNKCDHTYGEWTVGLKPTCMLPGRQDRVCTICGEKESQTIEPLGHSAVVVDEVPSTCQSTGLSSYEKCERCNNILSSPKNLPLAEHKLVWEKGKAPTCSSAGESDWSYCEVCEKIIDHPTTINPLPHTPVVLKGEEATCEINGLTDGEVCEICQTVLVPREIILAKGHNIVNIPAVEPTCKAEGSTAGTQCSTCEKFFNEPKTVPKSQHREIITPGFAPTCTKAGCTDASVCGYCGIVMVEAEIIPPKGHSEDTLAGYAATCHKTGLTDGIYCRDCNEILVPQTEIAKLNHIAVVFPAVEPTCDKEGYTEGAKCKLCGTITAEPMVIAPKGHRHKLLETKDAECEIPGYKLYQCTVCHATEKTEIPALAHKAVIDEGRAPTTEQQGLTEGSHCELCQRVLVAQSTIPRLVDYVVSVENGAMGSVNTNGVVLAPGEKITLIATPSEGYAFLGWYYTNGVCASTNPEASFDVWDPDKSNGAFNSLEARFYALTKLEIVAKPDTPAILGGGYYDIGDEVTLTVEEKAHYRIEGWYIDGECVSKEQAYTLTIAENQKQIEVRFEVAYHLEMHFNSSFGKVEILSGNIAEDGYVFEGESVRLKVTPNEAFLFLGFYSGDTLLSDETTFVFEMPSVDKRIEARFEGAEYSLHLLTTIPGLVHEGSGVYKAGSLVTIVAAKPVGMRFVGWLDAKTQEIISGDMTYTFEMPARDYNLYGIYEEILYQVTVSTNTPDITITSPDAPVREGNTLSFTAPANENYRFLGWYAGEECVCKDETYTFDVLSDTALVARYAKYYNIDASVNIEGAGKVSAPDKAYVGETVTLKITEKTDGYHFHGWYLGEELLTDEYEYTFTMSEGDIAPVARFEKLYTITVLPNKVNGGTYSAPKTAFAGETVTLKLLSVKSGYEFFRWRMDELHGSPYEDYTFTMPAEDVTVELLFKKIVKVNVTSNYEMFGFSGTTSLIEGENGWLEVADILDERLRFDGFFINGVCVESGTRYEFVAGDEDINIVMMYTEFFPLNVWSENEEYKVYIENDMVPAGTMVTLRADAPSEKHYFMGWFTGNMECIGTDLELTVEMPEGSFYIYAAYGNLYTITVTVNAPSELVHNVEYKVRQDETITLTAEELIGNTHRFDGWYVNGELYSHATELTFYPVADTRIDCRYWNIYSLKVEYPKGVSVSGQGYYVPTEVVHLSLSGSTSNFLGWYLGDELLSSALEFDYKMPNENVTIVVKFSIDKWNGSIANAFSGGDGSSSSPYLISTGAELARLASLINDTTNNAYYNKYYRLTADIDLASINWSPIGTMHDSSGNAQVTRAFQGNFDGNGHTIYNLNISSVKASNFNYVGLFGCAINASIYDLNLEGARITANNCTVAINLGLLVGRADSCTITRCAISGNISHTVTTTSDMYVGGLAGRSYTSTISDCIVSGNFSATSYEYNSIYLGGAVGYAGGVTLTRCITTTTCYAETRQTPCAGGLVGYMQENSRVTNCLSLGSGEAYSSGNYTPYSNKFCAYTRSSTTSNCYATATYTEAFFTSTLGFSTSVWDLSGVAEGKLPLLIQQ